MIKTLLIFLSVIRFSFAGGTLYGTVTAKPSGLAIAGAEIQIVGTDFRGVTDASGYFEINDIFPGTYQIAVQHPQYKKRIFKHIVLTRGDRRLLNIQLTRKEIPPAPVGRIRREMSVRSAAKKEKSGFFGKRLPKSSPPPEKEISVMEAPAARDSEPRLSQSGLRAGYADDNRQYNLFTAFLEKYKQTPHYPLHIRERIRLTALDINGKSIPNAFVQIYEQERLLAQGRTYADGTFFIFPQEINLKGDRFSVLLTTDSTQQKTNLNRFGPRAITIQMQATRPGFTSIPLDLLFILDTTGSMGEEIERLKSTIELINLNLSTLNIKPAIRYGMVLYRDRSDDYVTQTIPFTSDLEAFRAQLQKVSADGGGDTPEDLQSALEVALHKMDWNPNGLRLAFIITDAGLHLDYGQQFTYADAAREAKKRAIKMFSVGTGGLNISGEYILRQIAQYTYGKYIFLTYGEKGESEGGHPGSVSHHTGTNFNAENLESIIIRFAKEDLAQVSAVSIEEPQPWFEAKKTDNEDKQKTLSILFTRAVGQLIDFSTMVIDRNTPAAILPFDVSFDSQKNNAEYFYEQLLLSATKGFAFKMVERKDLQTLTKEAGLRLSGLTEEDNAARIGEFIGAELLITGKFYFKDGQYELFLKLLRVQTAEVLSVTRVRIDPRLGL